MQSPFNFIFKPLAEESFQHMLGWFIKKLCIVLNGLQPTKMYGVPIKPGQNFRQIFKWACLVEVDFFDVLPAQRACSNFPLDCEDAGKAELGMHAGRNIGAGKAFQADTAGRFTFHRIPGEGDGSLLLLRIAIIM